MESMESMEDVAGMDVVDSPRGWVAKHIRSYVETSGAKGGVFYGVEALLLTTRGRKSSKLRRTALYYGRDGERFIVVASNGGADKHPLWYLNVVANPDIRVQVGAETFPARARPATASERPSLWDQMVSIFPTYAQYERKAPREIPVVIIERAALAS